MHKEQRISENDAIRIFEAIGHENRLELAVIECVETFDQMTFLLTTNDNGFQHVCYMSLSKNFSSYENIKWIELQVQIDSINSFCSMKHINILNLVLFYAKFGNVMFYNATGEHVLIKKGTTLEELLVKVDLRA